MVVSVPIPNELCTIYYYYYVSITVCGWRTYLFIFMLVFRFLDCKFIGFRQQWISDAPYPLIVDLNEISLLVVVFIRSNKIGIHTKTLLSENHTRNNNICTHDELPRTFVIDKTINAHWDVLCKECVVGTSFFFHNIVV